MRCLLIIRNPSMPDIVFVWCDRAFRRHIIKSAVERGLLEPNEVNEDDDLDISVTTQYFSPIVASHGLLSSEMNCPYSSITCNNGFIFVIKQFGQHLYIAVNGNGQEKEQFLHKKLLVFHRIVQFFFGPVSECLRPDVPSRRDALWDTLGTILENWCELYHRDQSFLLEAVERLEVNQTLNELCIGLLESVLLKFRSAGDKNAVHAMLITGAKLLALFSSRNAAELQPSDVLLIIILVRTLFPSPKGPLQEIQEMLPVQQRQDRESRHSGILSEGDQFLSAGEGGGSDASSYYSTVGSHDDRSPLPSDVDDEAVGDIQEIAEGPRTDDTSTSGDSHTDSWCDLAGGHGADMASIPSIDCTPSRRIPQPPNSQSQTIWYTPIEDTREPPDNTGSSSALSSDQAPPSTSTTSTSTRSTTPTGAGPRQSRRGHRKDEGAQLTVFLQQQCPYSPHILHIVPLLPTITLVVVTEVNSQVATWINNCTVRLNVLMNAISKTDTGEVLHKQSSVGKLDADLKQLGNAVRKSKIPGLQQVHAELIRLWVIAKGCGLTTNQGASSSSMTTRLESTLSEMSKVLKNIFRRCYINSNTPLVRPPSRFLSVIMDVQFSLKESLSLYHDYLAVKAERNITMTNYLEDFPGLVHFIHVNRTTDQLLAPSINMSCEAEQAGVEKKLLHDKVWSMVERCHDQLQQGYIMETVRQGDFTLSYFLYYEDMSGLFFPNRGLPKVTKSPMPGIFAGKFYRELLEHSFPGSPPASVSCCELFCLHLSVVPTPMITSQVRRLRSMLGSGEAITPVNLL